MSRAAVYDAFISSPDLIALGFDNTSILVNYDGEQRPSDTMFIVLHWENETALNVPFRYGPIKVLSVWVHMYRAFSTDFVRIDEVFCIIDDLLWNLVDVPGDDGITLTLAEPLTKSRDLRDDAYQTLCRSASYRILSRATVSA